MTQQYGKVAVVFGGKSAERNVSLDSGQAVLNALLSQGVDAHAFDPAHRSIAEFSQFDRAFIVLHGRGGEDGQLQGVLEWLDIPYTGSGVQASAIGMDKVKTKQIWHALGLPTAKHCLLTPKTDFAQIVDQLGLPLIVKPSREGSSIGMSRVDQLESLEAAYQTAAEYDAEIMAEQWISGEEYTVVVLAGQVLPVIRLQPPKDLKFYDYDAKYQRNDTEYHLPSGLADAEEAKLKALAKSAFDAVNATGWGRIDAMRDQNGDFWLLEINTVPGMTSHSLVPKAAEAVGLSFEQLCLNILRQTLAED